MGEPDDAFLDHGDEPVLGDDDPILDENSELFVLFAEALDPNTDKTVDQAANEWKELLK